MNALALYGPEMHRFVLDELELGNRVATFLDSENNYGPDDLKEPPYDRPA